MQIEGTFGPLFWVFQKDFNKKIAVDLRLDLKLDNKKLYLSIMFINAIMSGIGILTKSWGQLVDITL